MFLGFVELFGGNKQFEDITWRVLCESCEGDFTIFWLAKQIIEKIIGRLMGMKVS